MKLIQRWKESRERDELRRRIETVIRLKIPKIQGVERLPWALIGARTLPFAVEFAYRVPAPYSVVDVEKQVDALSAQCGALIEIVNRGGAVIIRVWTKDFPMSIPFAEPMLQITKGRCILIGYNRKGETVIHDFRVPHLLIAGMSGYGKTDFVRWVLFQLISRFSPEEVDIRIIDMKGFSFLPLKGVPHIREVVTTISGAWRVLASARQEMERRARLVLKTGNRDICKTFPWRVVLIDEATQISPDLISGGRAKNGEPPTRKDMASFCLEHAIAISSIGREAGVSLIYATQYPTAQVIPGLIKANMDNVVSFKVENEIHAQVALGHGNNHSAHLPHGIPGRAIVKANGFETCQVPYIGNDETWEKLLIPYKTGGEWFYDNNEEDDNEGTDQQGEDIDDDGEGSNCLD